MSGSMKMPSVSSYAPMYEPMPQAPEALAGVESTNTLMEDEREKRAGPRFSFPMALHFSGSYHDSESTSSS
ncbi:MAG: hypothetical protein LBJ46_00580 [Planctomycetota bacterium]|nr:hypothetical protein [Planctomycetota bacterium]